MVGADMFSTTWKAVQEASYPMLVALMGYITYWLRTHIGKSNGYGPLNNQTEDLIKRISRLEKKLDSKSTATEEDESEDDSEGC